NRKKGYLRLTTARVDTSFLMARNTLTQRTIGPKSTGTTAIDISKMKEGDVAGLALLQKNYGWVGVKFEDGKKYIVMEKEESENLEEERVPLDQKTVYFKAECDFEERRDVAKFFYSLDGKSWKAIGTELKMSYTLPHFMGYRFGLFNYATKTPGGSV